MDWLVEQYYSEVLVKNLFTQRQAFLTGRNDE
jgi:hypothetical protein